MDKSEDTIDITVAIKVRVNKVEWNAEYGSDESARDIRAAVKAMAKDAVVAGFQHIPDAVEVL